MEICLRKDGLGPCGIGGGRGANRCPLHGVVAVPRTTGAVMQSCGRYLERPGRAFFHSKPGPWLRPGQMRCKGRKEHGHELRRPHGTVAVSARERGNVRCSKKTGTTPENPGGCRQSH